MWPPCALSGFVVDHRNHVTAKPRWSSCGEGHSQAVHAILRRVRAVCREGSTPAVMDARWGVGGNCTHRHPAGHQVDKLTGPEYALSDPVVAHGRDVVRPHEGSQLTAATKHHSTFVSNNTMVRHAVCGKKNTGSRRDHSGHNPESDPDAARAIASPRRKTDRDGRRILRPGRRPRERLSRSHTKNPETPLMRETTIAQSVG